MTSPLLPRFRTGYDGVSLHLPEAAAGRIDLSDNVNLWGSPPEALAAVATALGAGAAAYPTPYGDHLKAAVADYLGVRPEMVVTGCGSDDVLDAAIRAFGTPGRPLAHQAPTFGMVPLLARTNGLDPVPVPLTQQLDADAAGFAATGAPITYLCSPNNPTGTPLSRGAVAAVAGQTPGLVLLDEAYAEFAGSTMVDLLDRCPRLVITRTLSKAFGLAGLRAGYGVGHPDVIREIEKARGPFKLSAPAEAGAVAALGAGRQWMLAHAETARQMRDVVTEWVSGIPGLTPIPSAANFLAVRVDADWGGAVGQAGRLRERGILVRAFPALPVVGDLIRFTVGPRPLMEALVGALREVAR